MGDGGGDGEGGGGTGGGFLFEYLVASAFPLDLTAAHALSDIEATKTTKIVDLRLIIPKFL